MNPNAKPNAQFAYRHDGERYLIELNIRDIRQLFNSLDPAPFREKDLDGTAEEYIVDATRELGLRRSARLVIHVTSGGLNDESVDSIAGAIRHYFEYRARHTADDLKQTLLRGAISLVIGLAFLFACLWLRQIASAVGNQSAQQIVTEGLLIMGWVAMWRPIDTFLYDWWPIRYKKRIFDRVLAMPIEIKTSSPP